MNPTSFSDLFDLNDSTPIDEAIAKIERLDRAYDVLVNQAKTNSKKYQEALDTITKSAQKLEQQLLSLDTAEKAQQEAVLKTVGETEKLITSQANVTKSYKNERDALAMLTDAQNKLKASKDTLNKQTILEAGSLGALKKELKEAAALYETYGDATSQAVKNETLKKIKDLSKAVAEGDKAIKDAKKGVDLAAGSYNTLASQVNEAKRKLKEMEGGIGGNSKEFKNLKKFAAEGTKQLKEFDAAVGDNQRNVGNYQDALNGLPGPLGAIASGFQSTLKAGMAFVTSPIGIFIGLLGLAFGSLISYFKRSTEGQDNLNKVLNIGKGIFAGLLAVLEPIGKAIFELFSNFNKLNAVVDSVGKAIVFAFENPGKVIKSFIDNSLKSVGVAFKGLSLIIKGDIADGFKLLANAGIQAVTGIENGFDKAAAAAARLSKKLKDEAAKQNALALVISALEAKIRKDKIKDVIEDSETELSVTKKLVDARNKQKFSDEQRYNFLRKANQELEDQLEGDLELTREQIALVDLEIQRDGERYELLEARAQLEASLNNQQTAFFNARKKRQQQEIALIQEIDKETQDRIKREADAARNLDSIILQGRIDANKEILSDDRSSSEQRLDAITEINDAELTLAENARDQQIAAAKEEALSRITLSEDTLSEIYNNEAISINERIAQERTAKEQLLGDDQAYVDTRIKITEQFFQATEKANEAAAQAVNDNIFRQLERDFKKLDDTVKTGTNEQLEALNQAYQDGNKSATEIARDRLAIQQKGEQKSLDEQLKYLQRYSDNLRDKGYDTTAIDRQIAETRVAISTAAADKQIENEKKVKDAVLALSQEIFAGATEIMANRTQARVDDLNRELQAESEKKDRSIAIVGEDAQAKAFIEAAFAAKQKEIQRQIIQERRKQAVFEKAVALTQAGINVALGISNALGSSFPPLSFILAALVGAAGAIQIAAIASKPIPQFYMGTKDSPEGIALVGDRHGRELIKEPGRDPYIADKPQYRYLKRHSIVYNNMETESLLNDAAMFGDGYGMPDQVRGSFENAKIIQPSPIDIMRLASSIDSSKKEIVAAIQNAPRDHYDEYGYRRYERSEGARVIRLDDKYKLQ